MERRLANGRFLAVQAAAALIAVTVTARTAPARPGLCPAGTFVGDGDEMRVAWQIVVDPIAGKVEAGAIPLSPVRVRRVGNATVVKARWKPAGQPWLMRLSGRLHAPGCDRLVARLGFNRRFLRRVTGAPVPRELLPATIRFTAHRVSGVEDPVSPVPPAPCANERGGPASATLTVTAGVGDLDIGWSGKFHNFTVPPGLTVAMCLDECSATEPRCRATARPSRMAGPPMPLLAAGVPLCVVPGIDGSLRIGTLDLETGAVDVPIGARADIHLTDAAAVCPRCVNGTCDGGSNAGAACAVDTVMTLSLAEGLTDTYPLSRSCPPLPDLLVKSSALDLWLTTDTSVLQGSPPCFAESRHVPPDDDCAAGCGAACTGPACVAETADPDDPNRAVCLDAKGGVAQVCCDDQTALPCFPTGDGGAIERAGIAVIPRSDDLAAWPDGRYPKRAASRLAAVTCATATGVATLDAAAGLPGPVSTVLPVELEIGPTADAR